MNKRPIDVEELKSVFHYADGWLYRIKSGRKCSYVRPDGYVQVQYMKRKYLVHRIVWALHYGNYPEHLDIDHINRNKQDNRIENLRVVTRSQNLHNCGKQKNKYGRHISYNPKRKLYTVLIGIDGKKRYFGSSKDLKKAQALARKARQIVKKEIFAPHTLHEANRI